MHIHTRGGVCRSSPDSTLKPRAVHAAHSPRRSPIQKPKTRNPSHVDRQRRMGEEKRGNPTTGQRLSRKHIYPAKALVTYSRHKRRTWFMHSHAQRVGALRKLDDDRHTAPGHFTAWAFSSPHKVCRLASCFLLVGIHPLSLPLNTACPIASRYSVRCVPGGSFVRRLLQSSPGGCGSLLSCSVLLQTVSDQPRRLPA